MNTDGIILFAKKSGPTSFKALNTIKKALGTSKVGHTGTLDSFAQGLLVVCTGRLTKLAGNITEFDKSYKAVIKFGEETDTLECTGNVIKTSGLPSLSELKSAIEKWTGNMMQTPPNFSAIHINGQRASDLARSGKETSIPARPVQIYKAELLETKLSESGLVEYALIDFSVSKGTYIRSLARDIAYSCNSTGHLTGLFRTRVGNFTIEEAAGFSGLTSFTIETAIKQAEITKNLNSEKNDTPQKFVVTPEELSLQEETRKKIQNFTEDTSKLCGFTNLHINSEFVSEFKNGKPLRPHFFKENIKSTLEQKKSGAVFAPDNTFIGLIEKNENNRLTYKFVVN